MSNILGYYNNEKIKVQETEDDNLNMPIVFVKNANTRNQNLLIDGVPNELYYNPSSKTLFVDNIETKIANLQEGEAIKIDNSVDNKTTVNVNFSKNTDVITSLQDTDRLLISNQNNAMKTITGANLKSDIRLTAGTNLSYGSGSDSNKLSLDSTIENVALDSGCSWGGNLILAPKISNGSVSDAEFQKLNGVSSAILQSNQKNQNNGVCGLDSNGIILNAQLPSSVNDIIEVNNFASLPGTGESSKIYVTLDNHKAYRWSGTAYVEISASLVIGTTSGTAYDGGSGRANELAIATKQNTLTASSTSGIVIDGSSNIDIDMTKSTAETTFDDNELMLIQKSNGDICRLTKQQLKSSINTNTEYAFAGPNLATSGTNISLNNDLLIDNAEIKEDLTLRVTGSNNTDYRNGIFFQNTGTSINSAITRRYNGVSNKSNLCIQTGGDSNINNLPIRFCVTNEGKVNIGASQNKSTFFNVQGDSNIEGHLNISANKLYKINGVQIDSEDILYISSSTQTLKAKVDSKQDLISAGTTAQYFRGDKSFQNFSALAGGNISFILGVFKLDSSLTGVDVITAQSGNNLDLKTVSNTDIFFIQNNTQIAKINSTGIVLLNSKKYFGDGSQLTGVQSTLTFGKASGNALKLQEAVVTNDFLIMGSSNVIGKTVAETKTLLAINNVDNTSDSSKPISTATQNALNAKQTTLTFGKANGNALKLQEAVAENDFLIMGANNVLGKTLAETKTLLVINNIVYTTGNQTIAGVKTFSSTIVGSIDGNSGTATKIASIANSNIVQLTLAQTISGIKTFSDTLNGVKIHIGAINAKNSKLYIDSAAASIPSDGLVKIGSVDYTGQTNKILLSVAPGEISFDKAGSAGGHFIIKSDGDVGINNPSPVYKLDVIGDISVNNGSYFMSNYTETTASQFVGKRYNQETKLVGGMEIENTGSGTSLSQSLHFWTHLYGTGLSRKMTITNRGRVGIGNEAPICFLDNASANGTIGERALRVGFDNNSNFVASGMNPGNSATPHLWVGNKGTDQVNGNNFTNGFGFVYNTSGNYELIRKSGSITAVNVFTVGRGDGHITFSADITSSNLNGNVGNRMKYDLSAGTLLLQYQYPGSGTHRMVDLQIATTNVSGPVSRGRIEWNGSTMLYGNFSDRRLKTDIVEIKTHFDILDKLNPVNYKMIDAPFRKYGFIADELVDVFPQCVSGEPGKIIDGNPDYMMVDETNLISILTQCLKDNTQEIKELKKDNEELKLKLNLIMEKLNM